ncbi:MAG: WYL domain-containing protein [Pyrinomonadaceae bacterium]|nr:WYL domain-containing protein [Pyrinomonadaceae bacterium]
MSYRQALAERLIHILFKLVRRPHSQVELAREFGVNAKTIRRDLDVLSLEYPIEDRRVGREVHYRFADDFKFDFPNIEIEELAVLLLAQEAVAGIGITAAGSFYAARAESLLDKIRRSLPRSVQAKMDALSKVYGSAAIPSKDFSAHSATIDRLASYALRRRKVEIRYHGLNSDQLESRPVAPYAVYFDPDGATLKLAAFDERKRRLSVFSIDRITHLKETGETFVRPADFDLTDFLNENCFNGIHGTPVAVRLKASGITARIFKERQFHPSQKIIESKQKRGASPETLTIEMRVAAGRGLVRFILSHLPHIEVVAPAELKAEVKKAIEDGLENFS